LEKLSKAEATPENVKNIDDQEKAIWQVADPNGPVSLAKLESRIKKVRSDVKGFDGKVFKEVGTVVAKEARSVIDRVRKPVRRVGTPIVDDITDQY